MNLDLFPFKSHNICSSHEKNMSAQVHYHFTLNGPETFDWQPTSSGVRLDLREGKGDGGALSVHAAHLRCRMVSWADWSQLVKKLHVHLLCAAARRSGPNWPQNYSWSPLSNAHMRVHRYQWWPRDCYVTCASALCRAERRAAQIKDHLLTDVISDVSHWEALNLSHNVIIFNYLWLVWSLLYLNLFSSL